MPLIPMLRVRFKRVLIGLGLWQRPALIVGTGENALDALEALESEPLMGLVVVAFAAPNGTTMPSALSVGTGNRRLPVVRLGQDVSHALSAYGRPTVVVALEQDELADQAPLVCSLHRICPELRVVPPVRGIPLFGAKVNHFFRHELLFLTLQNNLARLGPRVAKRLFDIGVSSVLLIALTPIFLYLSWRVRQDGGPVFFSHTRIGRSGKVFPCWKFRTMVPHASVVLQRLLDADPSAKASWEKDFKLKNDPRITRIGRFLRQYSLDELPQLWNVLKGEMSLVGPRPIVSSECERYGEELDYYLEARPGMTGLWQISGRNNTDYDYRVYLDAWYVKNWSLWYDVVIMMKTIRVVVAKDGAY